MKPPICEFCSHDFRASADEGGLVYFKKTEANAAWHRKQEAEGFVGHPPEAAWFCGLHYQAAKELSHLTLPEAMRVLNDHFNPSP